MPLSLTLAVVGHILPDMRLRRSALVLTWLLVAWQVATAAMIPFALRLATVSSGQYGQASASNVEVCEHHAMPGAMCPMHAQAPAQSSTSDACRIAACDSLVAKLFTLFGIGAPLAAPIQVEAPAANREPLALVPVLLIDSSPSPLSPPPRA